MIPLKHLQLHFYNLLLSNGWFIDYLIKFLLVTCLKMNVQQVHLTFLHSNDLRLLMKVDFIDSFMRYWIIETGFLSYRIVLYQIFLNNRSFFLISFLFIFFRMQFRVNSNNKNNSSHNMRCLWFTNKVHCPVVRKQHLGKCLGLLLVGLRLAILTKGLFVPEYSIYSLFFWVWSLKQDFSFKESTSLPSFSLAVSCSPAYLFSGFCFLHIAGHHRPCYALPIQWTNQI